MAAYAGARTSVRSNARWLISCSLLCLLSCSETPESTSGRQPATALPVGERHPNEQTYDASVFNQLALEGATIALFPNDVSPDLLTISFDSTVFEPVIIAEPNQGISADDAMTAYELDALIGSGFVSELHSLQPVGLLHQDGSTFNEVQRHGYTRILGINQQGLGVVHRESYQRDLFDSAIQAGPGIIEQGELDIAPRDLARPKYFRSAVALCANRWIFVVSVKPTNLRTLGQDILRYLTSEQCEEVVNLAGDREAVLLAQDSQGRRLYHGNPDTYKVSLIGMRRKSAE